MLPTAHWKKLKASMTIAFVYEEYRPNIDGSDSMKSTRQETLSGWRKSAVTITTP